MSGLASPPSRLRSIENEGTGDSPLHLSDMYCIVRVAIPALQVLLFLFYLAHDHHFRLNHAA